MWRKDYDILVHEHAYIAGAASCSRRFMDTSNNDHQHISRGRATLLIGLAILIVAGGFVFFSKWKSMHSPSRVDIPANSSAAMFGFDLHRTHFIPSERILSTANVSHLVP